MQKENNKKIGFGIAGVVVLIVVFYGGMIYGGNNIRASINNRGATFGQNNIGEMRGIRNGGGTMGNFIGGEIISKDDKSLTIKLQDGGSKIILLGTNTTIVKIATGSTSDLTVGTSVSIAGTTNTDGSVTAKSVQIRPNIPPVLK